LLTVTTLGAGSLTAASQAAGAASTIRAAAYGPIDAQVASVLSLLDSGLTSVAQVQVDSLSAA